MKKIFLVSALVLGTYASAQATDVTWADKVANDNTAPLEATEQFSAADANAVKTAVNSKANLSRITWVTGTTYTAGDTMVAHNGHVFICKVEHTSGATTEPGEENDWATVWKYHGSDLYAAALTSDQNYVSDAEKSRLGDLESSDSVSFAGVTATGSGGLVSGVAGIQQGALTLYSNADIYPFGILPAPTPTATVTLKFPPAMPTADNSLLNFDINGTGGWTDPATFLTPTGVGGSLTVTATGFDGNLATTDNTVQEIAQKFDDFTASAGFTNLTSFVSQTPWRLFYSDGSGDVKEVAMGSDGTYLRSNGASAVPTFDTPSGAAHDAISLGTDADVLLGLSTQQVTLDSQTANYIFAAPNGSAGDPIFRALVDADIPDTLTASNYSLTSHNHTGTYEPADTDLTDLADGSLTGSKVGTGINGDNITSGTVADARIASTIARDSELPNLAAPGTIGGTTPGVVNATTIAAGSGGFAVDADGDATAKSLTVTKVSGSAGDMGLYEANSTDTHGAGFRGPASITGDGAYRGVFANAGPTEAAIQAWGASTSGTGTASDPYIHSIPFITLSPLFQISGSAISFTSTANPNMAGISFGAAPSTAGGGGPRLGNNMAIYWKAADGSDVPIALDSSDILQLGQNASGINFNNVPLTGMAGVMTNPMTTAGDMVKGGTSGAPARMVPGTGVVTLLETPTAANFFSALTGEGAFAATLFGYADAAAVRSGIGAAPAADAVLTGSTQLPNGANPTTDAAGEIAVDTSTGAGQGVRAYGAVGFTLPAYQTKCTTINAATSASDFMVERFPYAITIRAAHLTQLGATNVVGHFDECDANGGTCATIDSTADITATTATANDDGTLSNPSIDANDVISWHTTSVSGTNTQTMVCFDYTVDQVN